MVFLAPLISGLVGALVAAAATMVGRAVIGMGFAMFTFTGVNTFLSAIFKLIKDQMSGLPDEIVAICSMMQVDVVITMLLSAYAARMLLNGLTSAAGGSIKRWGMK